MPIKENIAIKSRGARSWGLAALALALVLAAVAIGSSESDASPATGIELDRSSVTLTAEDDVVLVATVFPSDCTDTVTWSSKNSLFVTVDQDGRLTPKAYGTARISATVGSYSAYCTVTVTYAQLPISQSFMSVEEGSSGILSVTVPEGYSNVVWRTSDSSVASVSGSGASAAVMGVSPGQATITVICANLYKATCTVTVTERPSTVDSYIFHLSMEADWSLADTGASGLTAEDLRDGITLTGTGINAGAALEGALDAEGIPCEFWSGSSGSQDLLYWVQSIMGLGDVPLANGDWKYWIQYHKEGGDYVYNEWTLGYYTGGGEYKLVYGITSDPNSHSVASVPSPATGLTYNGKQQTGVPSGTGYSISGNKATAAGSYTATLTLESGYVWSDGTAGVKSVAWSISKAVLTATYVGETIESGSVPAYAVTVAGFVNGESASTAANYVAPRVVNSDLTVGTHTLAPSGGSAKNYSFRYVPGTLVVTEPQASMEVGDRFTVSGLTYEVVSLDPAAASLAGYVGNVVSVTVPSSVDYGGVAYAVTSVGSSAFLRCSTLASVDLGDVKALGFKAFGNCSGITEMTFGGFLESIGSYALYGLSFYDGDTKLKATPDNLRGRSFEGSGGVLRMVADSAFTVGGISYEVSSPGAVTITGHDAGVSSVPCEVSYGGRSYAVEAIGDSAFLRCSTLTSVDLSNARTLGFKAFGNCTGITQVTFGYSLESIGSYALYGLSFYDGETKLKATPDNLRSRSFEGSGGVLRMVADSAFTVGGISYEVSSPGAVTITGHDAGVSSVPCEVSYGGRSYAVEAIGDSAFLRCASLTSVDLSNVKTLGFKAFGNCTGITEMTFGDSLESIGSYALRGLSFYDGETKLKATPENLRGHTFAGEGAVLYLVS